MTFLKNTVSLLAVFCVIPMACGAATPRVSFVTKTAASPRLPTLTTVSPLTTTTTTSSSSSLMADSECIDAYKSCIMSDDVCGLDMSECTTNVLFHGKMPLCFSTLYQCSSSGINTLFGTSSINALSNISTTNAAGEVTRYTYPTDGSVLGQMVIGAAISNRFSDVSTCVKKYKSCLFKDSVCGEEFELCTNANSFKKQGPYCDSVLARCDSNGIKELFGTENATTRPVGSYGSGTVAEWVAEGADLAAANAVNTCYKTIDNCFLSACAANPYRCIEGTDMSVVETADLIGSGEDASRIVSSDTNGAQTAANVKKYFKTACLDTIGTNQYCYMTFNDGKRPSKSDLTDPDSQEDLFSEAYSARKTYVNSKLQDLVTKFDTRAKDSCNKTIKSCAMRSCGGGVGAACYSLVFGNGGANTINGSATYDDIKNGCSAIVNTDANCRYSAAVTSSEHTYNYMYNDAGAFGALFPENDSMSVNIDPIGAIAALNASLSTSYNDAAIANMKKQCQAVATSCVKSMCGTDYVNCYRNRTDIYSSLTSTGEDSFDRSMNKVGGVLDYTIVLGLCLDTVKNADVCSEHLAIAQSKISTAATAAWGQDASSVRNEWVDAGAASKMTGIMNFDMGASQIRKTDENGNDLCTTKGGSDEAICYTVDAEGNIYDQPVYQSYNSFVETQAASSLFKDLVYDIEKEAQAKYNAKLTKQQNMCMSGNTGGIMGKMDTGSTYMWAKLKNNKVPNDYIVNGLKTSQFVASNDLYGSFCRIKVTVQSDDKYIQQKIKDGANWATAYFAAGDAFTCGSWISQDDLTEITENISAEAVDSTTLNAQKRTRGWLTAVSSVAGAVGGGALTNNLLSDKDSTLGGLLGTAKNSKRMKDMEKYDYAQKCVDQYKAAEGLESADVRVRTHIYNSVREYAIKAGVKADKTLKIERTKPSEGNDSCSSEQWAWLENQIAGEFVNAEDVCAGKGSAPKLVGTWTEDKGGKERSIIVTCSNNGTVSLNNSVCKAEDHKAVCVFVNAEKELKYTIGCKPITYFDSTSPNFKAVADECQAILDMKGTDEDLQKQERKQQKRLVAATAVGAGLGATTMGFTTYYAIKDAQDSENEAAQREAVNEWMDNIGRKIKCYIGSDEVGSYGDIISTELE